MNRLISIYTDHFWTCCSLHETFYFWNLAEVFFIFCFPVIYLRFKALAIGVIPSVHNSLPHLRFISWSQICSLTQWAFGAKMTSYKRWLIGILINVYAERCWCRVHFIAKTVQQGWLVVLGLTALWDSISVYIGPSPREREKEKRSDRWEKKIVQTTPTRTYCKHNRPLPYCHPN